MRRGGCRHEASRCGHRTKWAARPPARSELHPGAAGAPRPARRRPASPRCPPRCPAAV